MTLRQWIEAEQRRIAIVYGKTKAKKMIKILAKYAPKECKTD